MGDQFTAVALFPAQLGSTAGGKIPAHDLSGCARLGYARIATPRGDRDHQLNPARVAERPSWCGAGWWTRQIDQRKDSDA